MSEKFNLEIISPDKTIIKSEVNQVTIPSYEGLMTVLKDHINLVTFLRPGFIVINDDKKDEFFVEEGTVEFSNNILLILTSKTIEASNLNKDSINELLNQAEKKLVDDITDKERYLLSYKIDTLKEIRQ